RVGNKSKDCSAGAAAGVSNDGCMIVTVLSPMVVTLSPAVQHEGRCRSCAPEKQDAETKSVACVDAGLSRVVRRQCRVGVAAAAAILATGHRPARRR